MYILGICGPKGAGKSTAASIIAQQFNNPRVYAFADPLKETLSALFKWPSYVLHDPAYKEAVDERYGVSPRYAMQTLGPKLRELITDNLWILRADGEIYEASNCESDIFIIPDVRYTYEAEFVRSFANSGILEVKSPYTSYSFAHESEKGLHPVHISWTIHNDGLPPKLANDAIGALEVLGMPTKEK